jgi:hypothetical protein
MTKHFYLLFLFVVPLSLSPITINAQKLSKYQKRLEEQRQENWPPERTYSRVSLGYALQNIFKRHCEYCGFKTLPGKRDYLPADISKFLGRRKLRTDVETANIRGGGLLFYLFKGEEIHQPFDKIDFTPSRIFHLNDVEDQFTINPEDNFDTYFMHKTCSAYLKSALDAGIQPPYSTFKAALETDSRRESSVIAISGSFISPLKTVLSANDYRTTETMLKLWQFYQENPEYINNLFFLREFEGVMLKHISDTEKNLQIEMEGGLNLMGPLPAHLKTSLGIGNNTNLAFSGTDWETIVYTDFDYPNNKSQLFSPLPSPSAISRYLDNIRPVFQREEDLPLMIEGIDYKHFLIVEGIPPSMCNNFWELANVQDGVYENLPTLQAEPYYDEINQTSGCRFTITGKPMSEHFQGQLEDLPGKLNVKYQIRSKQALDGQYLTFAVNEEVQTSAHPIANISGGEFDLTKKEGWEFAFQWQFAIEIEDAYNPVDFNQKPHIGNLVVRQSDKPINVRIIEVQADTERKRFMVTLETQDSYSLDKIDHSSLDKYNLSLDIHLKSAQTSTTNVRPIKGILKFPSLKKAAPKEPRAEMQSAASSNI